MTRYRSCTEYWVDPKTGTFRGEFEKMYSDIEDPWGCEAGKSSLNNRIFLDVIFADDRRYERILDIGCGLGGLLSTIRARNGGGYVLGVDVSATAVEKARRQYPEVSFQQRNIVTEDLGERDFDLVVTSEVLWYMLDNLPLFYDRIEATMSHGGVLAVHQYFPTEQRFGKDVIDGLSGYLRFMESREGLVRRHMLTSYQADGLILLATFSRVR
jgi:2-polyprenyl-3-methyl-5-hydroxy-6-metoxy-1,4-benzoquinol methylase